ncbi:MAG: hypothetical protein FWD73_10835 [Polyangiaceae bacterium]|nr:hypothetical protein [Polyangiaceae bacterium]
MVRNSLATIHRLNKVATLRHQGLTPVTVSLLRPGMDRPARRLANQDLAVHRLVNLVRHPDLVVRPANLVNPAPPVRDPRTVSLLRPGMDRLVRHPANQDLAVRRLVNLARRPDLVVRRLASLVNPVHRQDLVHRLVNLVRRPDLVVRRLVNLVRRPDLVVRRLASLVSLARHPDLARRLRGTDRPANQDLVANHRPDLVHRLVNLVRRPDLVRRLVNPAHRQDLARRLVEHLANLANHLVWGNRLLAADSVLPCRARSARACKAWAWRRAKVHRGVQPCAIP